MRVTLRSEGQTWYGWQSFSIKKTMDKAQHSFTMTTTDQYQEGLERWNVGGGSFVEIFFGDDLAFAGYVQKYNPTIEPEGRTITISGESKAIDLVETSHDGQYFWKDTTSEQIIAEVVEPYGIDVDFRKPLKAIGASGFRAGVGDTPFGIMKKLAERAGLIVFTDNSMNLVVADADGIGGFSELTTGDYVRVSANHDISKSFSQIKIKGQQNTFSTDFEGEQRGEFVATNNAQPRYRPLVAMMTGDMTDQEALGKYVNRRLNGDSLTASVTVKSAYDKEGNMWSAGQRVWLSEDRVDVNDELIVGDLTFSLDQSSGFTTVLNLKLPQTYTESAPSRRQARRSGGFFQNLIKSFL